MKKTNTKSKIKYIYYRIDNKIIDIISGRNIRHKRRIAHSHPSIGDFKKSKNVNTMLTLANKYDIKEFFVYKVKLPKTKLSIGRRGVLRLYVITRDSSIRLTKSIYNFGWSK